MFKRTVKRHAPGRRGRSEVHHVRLPAKGLYLPPKGFETCTRCLRASGLGGEANRLSEGGRMIGPSPSHMKAWLIDKPGSIRSLYMDDKVPVPEPGPQEARVCVYAAGLNPVDSQVIIGVFENWHYPQIPGLDMAGTIEALGPEPGKWQIGTRVLLH